MTGNENKRPKMTMHEKARLQAFKNVQEKKTSNPYRKDVEQAVIARKELSNLPISLEEKKEQIAESYRIHGQQNPNKKTIYQDSNNISDKEEKDVKKSTVFKHLNKDSFIVSAFLVTLGLVGYWYIRWNFNEIFIYFIIFGGLLKIILDLLGKGND